MNADAEFNPPVIAHAGVAVQHGALDLERAAHRVDYAAKLDDHPVARALDHAAVVHGDGRIEEIATERS
jgi:hypothetical protein